MPTVIGFHCSHEQLPPSILLRNATLAADAGFEALMCSDHFHPWSERQGQSGFAWSWLGAALQATTTASFGTVCAPGQRYHPAVIAQAAATLAEMFPGRFWLALGSGEAVNEQIAGPWPDKPARHARLRECVEVMRALWAGDCVTLRGHTTTQGARLYTRPAQPPLIVGAALTPDTARWAGSWADALVTVAGDRERMQRIVDAFRDGGGAGKPLFLQVALAYAPTDAEALAAAHDQWRQPALPTMQLAELDSVAAFDRATADTRPEDVLAGVRVSADIERHIDWLHEDRALGFERIYLHNVARDHQELFIRACAARLLPAFAGRPLEDTHA